MAVWNDSPLLASRRALIEALPPGRKSAEEGGCGVTGFACSVPVGGRHIIEPSCRMHNRGNGKGGGIAAVGLVPEDLGVSREVLDTHYLLHVAYLDPDDRAAVRAVEERFIAPRFDVAHREELPHIADYRDIRGLDVRPPDIVRTFARAKPAALARFIEENDLSGLPPGRAEDEFVYRTSFEINTAFYSTLGEKKAFVMSHGRDMAILKIVGYAEVIAQYYRLEDFRAHIWIAHQRYPTKGRVWHPGGAHPFIGMDEALVHNGDFANYHSVCEYLKQRNIAPLFHTDTEVSVLLFDLWNRVYGYPLEYIIEALAPTSERDFDRLPEEKQRVYRAIQATHIHASPDGPWFFIIARNDPYRREYQLIGITDTAMLRPQVFALHEGEVQVGLVCSEKQAIDATLESLAAEDPRVSPVADKYWNARGGSHTDGGTFVFTCKRDESGAVRLSCADKFGTPVAVPKGGARPDLSAPIVAPHATSPMPRDLAEILREKGPQAVAATLISAMPRASINDLRWACDVIAHAAEGYDSLCEGAIETLTTLNDRRFPTGSIRRSDLLRVVRASLDSIFAAVPALDAPGASPLRRIALESRDALRPPVPGEETLVVNVSAFPPEGDDCDSRLLVSAYGLGWRRFILFGCRGQRFTGCGFGLATSGVRIDVYGSSGDYLASGIDGMEIRVHGNAQDQLGQIMKGGKLAVYGDVGQTFMYGAKGGEVYVLGNAAGRPLINAVGRPRVVVNGTALDYLAESFMAGDPHQGGGFVILNGIAVGDDGAVTELPSPYPGANLFSLASGGAIFARDPHRLLTEDQLNGGEFTDLSDADWRLILPYLQENEHLFGISVERDILTVNGTRLTPAEVYRKVRAVTLAVLASAKNVLPEDDDASHEWKTAS